LSRRLGRAAAVVLGLFLFVLALELLKKGAGGIGPLLRQVGVSGIRGGLGVGWLAACVLLSGSPVAAMALTLLASGTLTTEETFGMIGGSRLGASFVVFVIGALDDLRARRHEKRSAYLGVAALVTTAVVYLPAMGLAWLGLSRGFLAGLRLEGRALAGFFEVVYGPLLAWLVALYVVWRRPTFERLLQAGCWLLLAMLLIAPIFRVWYVTWPLALVALLDWRPAGRAVASLATAAPFMYVQAESPAWLDALIFLPVIVLLAYELRQARLRRQLCKDFSKRQV